MLHLLHIWRCMWHSNRYSPRVAVVIIRCIVNRIEMRSITALRRESILGGWRGLLTLVTSSGIVPLISVIPRLIHGVIHRIHDSTSAGQDVCMLVVASSSIWEASTLLGRRRARRAWAKYYSVKKFSFGAYEFSSFSLEYWAADLRMSSSVVRLVVLRVESAGVAQMDEV